MGWPSVAKRSSSPSEKLSYISTSQYEGTLSPGPGNYNISTKISKMKKSGKVLPHKVLREKKNTSPNMTTYNPCSIEFSTFDRISKS